MKRIYSLIQEWKEKNLLLPIWMEDRKIRLVDQHLLPLEYEVYTLSEVSALAQAIRSMAIRGSGAIGTAGAYGMLLAASNANGDKNKVIDAAKELKGTRPTAINLMKTVDELLKATEQVSGNDLEAVMEEKVCDILERQLSYEMRLGEFGAECIEDGDTILTHCHSGALAGSGYGGRALSVIRKAFEQGKKIHVYTSETRPYLQGARITAYELEKFGIPHTLITDGMSGYLMRLGKIQKVVVGSDRVAGNGDLINKVGTYMHALAAKENGIPFYAATSSHTIDFELEQGMDIKVEFRPEREVTHLRGHLITVPGTHALYPSFDVTPNELIAGIITEYGVIRPEYKINLHHINSEEEVMICH